MVATLFVAGTLNVEVAVAAEAGICTPSTGVIGDGGGLKTDNDDGVATWVGRDMYVVHRTHQGKLTIPAM
ncbi:hypothetical protein [Bifidobacterium canis]|nr:hypothetical protein [Bifidobacterium canis]